MKKFGIPARIDEELIKIINDIAKKNDISKRKASKYIANAMRDLQGKKIIKEKVINEIRF